MDVKQIYTLVNTAMKETVGDTVVLQEDLGNLVEVGDAVFDSGAVDNYGRTITNLVGKTIFVNRPYEGRLPSLRRDAWTYGSVLRKIRVVPMEAEENESWELRAGASYDPNIFRPAETHEKFFNKRTTFQVPISLTEIQIRESFQSVESMNSFLSMIETMIQNVLTKAGDNLAIRAVNNMIAETIYDDYGSASLSSKSGVKAVNLLYLYNQTVTDTLTADEAITNPDFIRFASAVMGDYVGRLGSWSKLFNVGGTDKFTPKSRMKTILLDRFAKYAGVFLYDATGQFKSDNIKLPEAETVPYWQGSGTDFSFSSISKIDVKTSEANEVEASGILGVMFDEEAVMITNEDKRVTTGYNPVGEFMNYWHKVDAQYLNDFDENFVVFFVA